MVSTRPQNFSIPAFPFRPSSAIGGYGPYVRYFPDRRDDLSKENTAQDSGSVGNDGFWTKPVIAMVTIGLLLAVTGVVLAIVLIPAYARSQAVADQSTTATSTATTPTTATATTTSTTTTTTTTTAAAAPATTAAITTITTRSPNATMVQLIGNFTILNMNIPNVAASDVCQKITYVITKGGQNASNCQVTDLRPGSVKVRFKIDIEKNATDDGSRALNRASTSLALALTNDTVYLVDPNSITFDDRNNRNALERNCNQSQQCPGQNVVCVSVVDDYVCVCAAGYHRNATNNGPCTSQGTTESTSSQTTFVQTTKSSSQTSRPLYHDSSTDLQTTRHDPLTSRAGLQTSRHDSITSELGPQGIPTRRPDSITSGPGPQTSRTDSITTGPGLQTSVPDSITSRPGLQTSIPDSITSRPGLQTSIPDSMTSGPGLQTSIPDSITSRPGPQGFQTRRPDSITSGPGPQTSIPDSTTSRPGLQTSIPDSITSRPGPQGFQTRRPDSITSGPGPQTSLPDSTTSRPGLQTSIPDFTTSRPGLQTSSPDSITSEPGLQIARSDSMTTGPGLQTSIADPITSGPGPQTTIADSITSGPGLQTTRPVTESSRPNRQTSVADLNGTFTSSVPVITSSQSAMITTTACAVFCTPTQKCIPSNQICDKYQDCPDDSDEINCVCDNKHYRCKNGRCIYKTWLCDGVKDCPMGDDESPPQCRSCTSTEFKCGNPRSCVPRSAHCDGFTDCSDSSDESTCLKTNETSIDGNLTTTSLVSVIYRGESGFHICSDNWNETWSDSVCKQMGHAMSSSTSYRNVGLNESFLVLNLSVSASNLLAYLQISNCTSNMAVAVSCVQSVCGRRSVSPDMVGPYILNGARAKRGAWPWQVLHYVGRYNSDGSFSAFASCGGMLINDRWILTAGHCNMVTFGGLGYTGQLRPGNVRILLGSLNRNGDADTLYERVDTVFVHPSFNTTPTVDNDVGLLRLSRAITFTDTIRPICLPTSTEDLAQFRVCVDTGFGKTLRNELSNDLLQARMNLLSYADCYNYFKNSYVRDPTQICAGTIPTEADINFCLGDSGGPLSCQGQDGLWKVIGINSYVLGTDDGTAINTCYLSVVARVTQFVDWIQQTISANSV